MTSQDMRVRCQAITQAGEPCKNDAQADSDYCYVHRKQASATPTEPVETSTQETEPAPAGAPDLRQEHGNVPGSETLLSDEELRRQLVDQLDELTDKVQTLTPEYEPPPFSAERLMTLIEEIIKKFPRQVQLDVVHRMRSALKVNVFDADVWKGAWYMLNYTVKYNADMVKRHFTGDYDTDEWGLDWELLDAVRPFFSFMYKAYWRVETSGMDNIPIEGRALLAANYSGQLPWDGTMVGTAVLSEHPAQRLVRTLYADWYARLPFLSSWLSRMGQALATEDNGLRLLEQDALVAVYPEGYQGVTKLYKDRYKLARFGDGGFVQIALKSQAPIIPVSVVGGEETYIVLGNSRVLTKATGLPAFPITPTFPWLGLLGLVPLPTKWFIDFGEPISVNGYDPGDADNLVLVAQVNDQVRNLVQEMVYDRLAKRKSVFLG